MVVQLRLSLAFSHSASPAVHDVGSVERSLEVADPPCEGNDRVGMIRHSKVWPGSVMKLLYLKTFIALMKNTVT